MMNIKKTLMLLASFSGLFGLVYAQPSIQNVLIRQLNQGIVNWQAPSMGPGSGINQCDQFKLFEIKMDISGLPTDLNNPNPAFFYYDPDVINLHATFISPSGNQFEIDGFYYHEYALDGCGIGPPINNPQLVPGSSSTLQASQVARRHYETGRTKSSNISEWRIRFAADEPGTWHYTIKLDVHPPQQASQNIVLPNYWFNCDAFDSRGYIKVNPLTATLEFKDATQVYLAGPIIQKDFHVNDNNLSYLGKGGVCQIKEYMKQLRQVKSNYFRMEMNGHYSTVPGQTVDPIELGILNIYNPNYSLNVEMLQENAKKYDEILEYAEAFDEVNPDPQMGVIKHEDIYLKLPISGFVDYDISGDPDVIALPHDEGKKRLWQSEHNPYFKNFILDPCDFVHLDVPISAAQSSMLNMLSKSIRYIIARWGYSRNIAAWEIIDEIDRCLASYNSAQYTFWFNTVSLFIKNKDLGRHLISPGGTTTMEIENNQVLLNVCGLPAIDLCESNGIMFHNNMPDYCTWANTSPVDLDKFFLRPENIRLANTKPYFHNSLFYNNGAILGNGAAELIDPNGFKMHELFWRSLMSGSFALVSPFFHFSEVFPNYSPDLVGAHQNPGNPPPPFLLKGQSEQYKSLRSFADIMDIGDELMTDISNIPSNTGGNPNYSTHIRDNNTNILLPCALVGRTNVSFTRQYGWFQHPGYTPENLNLNGCGPGNYFTDRTPSSAPSVTQPLNLGVPVLVAGDYRFTWYHTAHLDPNTHEMVHELTALPPNSNNNIIHVSANTLSLLTIELPVLSNGNLNLSAYGDLVYLIEFVGDAESNNSNKIDLVRLADLNNDGADELILNNRELSDEYSLKAFTVPSICLTAPPCSNNTELGQFTIKSKKSKYVGWMDHEDLFLVADVSASIPGKEYILVDKNQNSNLLGTNFLAVMNPANGNFIVQRPMSALPLIFFDNDDHMLLGNVDNDPQDEMIFINVDPTQSSLAVVVYDPIKNVILNTINHFPNSAFWLGNNDRCFLADVDGGDGKKELVLINAVPVGITDFIMVVNLNTGLISRSQNYTSNPSYNSLLNGWACHRVLVGNMTGSAEEEIILINKNTNNLLYTIIDPSTLLPYSISPTSNSVLAEFINDNEDRTLLADFNGDGYKELLFIDSKITSPTQNDFLHVTLNNPSSITETFITNTGYNTWVEKEDVVLHGKLSPGTLQEHLLLVNRNNFTANPDITLAMDLSNPNAISIANLSPYLPINSSTSPYERFVDNHISYLCDGTVLNNGTQSGGGSGSGGTFNKTSPTVSTRDIVPTKNLHTYYPNPVRDVLFVQKPVCHYTIYNMLGSQVLSGHTKADGKIDVHILATGMYVLHCQYDDGSILTGKFTKN